MLRLTCLAALVAVLPCQGQPANKILITGTTNEHIQDDKYRVLPKVRILVSRASGLAIRNPRPAKGESGWRSNAKGQFSIEVTSGEPVTLVFLFDGEKHLPQVEKMSAIGGAEYRVSPALTTVTSYNAQAAKNPSLPPARTLIRLAARSLPSDLQEEEAKEIHKSFDGLLKTAPSPTSLLVPMYIYPPTQHGKKEWARLNAAASQVPVAAIVNPENGPGPDIQKPVYEEAFTASRKAGVKLMGYIHTQRGERPIERVAADVDRWRELYGQHLTGLFVDEQASGDKTLPYYRKLADHIRKTFPSPGFQIIGNPGCPFDEGYLRNRANDATCFYEGRGAKNWDDLKVPSFLERQDVHRGVVLRYKLDKADALGLLKTLVREEIGYLYLTDAHLREDRVEDPWHRLPEYWDEEVKELSDAIRQADQDALPRTAKGKKRK